MSTRTRMQKEVQAYCEAQSYNPPTQRVMGMALLDETIPEIPEWIVLSMEKALLNFTEHCWEQGKWELFAELRKRDSMIWILKMQLEMLRISARRLLL